MSAATLAAQKHRAAQQDHIARLHRESWTKDGIIPDVVQVTPQAPALIHWGPHQAPNHVHLGQELTPTLVAIPPLEFHWQHKADELYTILFVDPDAPSRSEPTSRNFLHWLVVNVPGEDISRGDTIADYVGSAPPEQGGMHRYVFLVYAQKGKRIDAAKLPRLKNTSFDGRRQFKVDPWLESVGGKDFELVGGNYYQAKYDASVPGSHSQLRGERPPPDFTQSVVKAKAAH